MSDFFAQIDRTPARLGPPEKINEIALLEFEKNSVEFAKNASSFIEMRKISKSDVLNNGLMLKFSPGGAVTVRDRPHKVYKVE